MRASISTIGPPYGTKAPPPRSIPAEGLIHASRQRFTASFQALGSTVLIRSGLLTKEDFPHTHILKNIPRRTRSELSEELSHRAGDHLRSKWRWRFALGQCLQLVGEYMYYRRFGLKRKCEPIFFWDASWNITQRRSFIFQSSVKAQCSCGALEERSALGWTFCCLPKCSSSPAQLFFFLSSKKCPETSRTGLKCSGSRSIWYEKWAD